MLSKDHVDNTNNPDLQHDKTDLFLFYTGNNFGLPLFFGNSSYNNFTEDTPHVNHYKIGD